MQLHMKRILFLLVLMLVVGVSASIAQTKKLSGRVLDDKGAGIPSAGVTVKGTSIGTVTDFDGNFNLEVPADATTLVVQGVGYISHSVTIGSGTILVRLKSQSTTMNETVVTALGISREKRSLGYTQSTVTADAIDKSGEQNTIQALSGKSAGILVTGSGGTPGASAQVLLRGNSNISGGVSTPLFVVDGVPIDNSTRQPVAGDDANDPNLSGVNESNRGVDLNPNDIESISVLRGPAAAALYGINGANGAIIITTKRGKMGKGNKRLGVEFSSNTEISHVNNLPKRQNTYLQGSAGVFNNESNLSWGPRADAMPDIKTYDKYKDFFQTGASYVNNVGLTWSSENAAFRLGIGNTKTDGVVPNSQFKRTTVNMHADAQLATFLRIGTDINYTNSEGTRVQNGSNLSGIMLGLLRAPINFNVNDYENPVTGRPNNYFPSYDNPKWTALHNPYNDKTNRVFGNVNAALDLLPGLTLTNRIGIDAYATNSRQIYDLYSNGNDNADGLGQINFYNANSLKIYNDLILRYDKRLHESVTFNGLIGFNYTYTDDKTTFSRGRNMLIPGLYVLSNTSSLYASNTEAYSRSQGLFAEATLGYRSTVYLTITGRNDWSSYYGRNAVSYFYPKADMAWIFSEHLKASNILTYGKLRIAFADAGKGPGSYLVPGTPYLQPFITDGSTNGIGFPYLGEVGFGPSNVLIDQNVKPEHTESKEIGLEARLFRSRVNMNITYYSQLTKDAIIKLPVAPSTGYSAYMTNGGTARNRGIEIELSADIIKSKDVTWNVFANYTRDRSRVMSINPQVSEVSVGNGFSDIGSYSIVGEPIGVFYGTVWERDSLGRILIDAQGRAVRSDVARKIGNPNPDWTMGLGSGLTIKGFNFSFLWDIRKGGDIWNGTWARLNRLGITDESADRERTYIIDGVYAPGAPNAGQVNTTPVSALYYYQTFKGDQGNYASENAIQDGGWVRLRSVNVSYRWMFNNGKKSRYISYLEIGLTGKNLLLFTKYKGVDPETSLTGAGSSFRGYDYFNNPGVKSYMLNVRLGL